MEPTAEFVSAARKVGDQLIQATIPWRQTLLVHPTIACRAAVQFRTFQAQGLRDQFRTFHANFDYDLADGEKLDGPTMHLEAIVNKDPDLADGAADKTCTHIKAMRMDIKMCNECASVARGMKCCNRCEQAWYCGRACQRAAWKLHKSECARYKQVLDYFPASTAEMGRPRRLVANSLREVLLPGRPQLCRFWLAALISAITNSKLEDVRCAFEPLIVYVWKYTWAAVPEPLRPKLIAALHSVMGRMMSGLFAGQLQVGAPPDDAGMKALRNMGVDAHMALSWILERDEECEIWCRGRPADQRLPDLQPSHPHADQMARDILTSAVYEQDGVDLWMPLALFHQVHDEVLVLRGGLFARGAGLLASPFGALAAPAACVRIIRRYTSFALGKAPLATVQQHAVPTWSISRCKVPLPREANELPRDQRNRGYLRLRANDDAGLPDGESGPSTASELAVVAGVLRLHGCGALPVEAACSLPREARPFKDEDGNLFFVLDGTLPRDVAALRLDREWLTGWSHAEIGYAATPIPEHLRSFSERLPDFKFPKR